PVERRRRRATGLPRPVSPCPPGRQRFDHRADASGSVFCGSRARSEAPSEETTVMTFKHKLSCRLALLKDTATLGVLAVVASCEVPSPFGPPERQVAQVTVVPGSLSLEPTRNHQF